MTYQATLETLFLVMVAVLAISSVLLFVPVPKLGLDRDKALYGMLAALGLAITWTGLLGYGAATGLLPVA
ncbi:hypothetical protein [Croceicoccus gelatinilyticus]|uniref:hypothetical protein n=1 Tax=Croceicoccus gelatinilyticus TaxID=2835536 RepID=UPI001BCBB4B2|nr:hypothetical protein [Croceicoccus gelatinilyticus]MBS7671501.1 hypothetical protein [Croceicoccus gelatinilyticus]